METGEQQYEICPNCPYDIELSIARVEADSIKNEADKAARIENIEGLQDRLTKRARRSDCPEPQVSNDGQLVCPYARGVFVIDSLIRGPIPFRPKNNINPQPSAPVEAQKTEEYPRPGTYL
jgi:hypothetical protein